MSFKMTPPEDVLTYRFFFKPELFWFVLVAVLTVLAQALIEFDPETITDWHAWAIALFAAIVRAAAGAFIAYSARASFGFTRHSRTTDESEDA